LSQYKPVPAGEVKIGQRVRLLNGTSVKIATRKYSRHNNEITFGWEGTNTTLVAEPRALLHVLRAGRPAGSRNKPKSTPTPVRFEEPTPVAS